MPESNVNQGLSAGRNNPSLQGRKKPPALKTGDGKSVRAGLPKKQPVNNLPQAHHLALRKIMPEQELEILDKYTSGRYSQPDLAKEYGVHTSTIWKLIQRLDPTATLDDQLARVGGVQTRLLEVIDAALERTKDQLPKANAVQAATIAGILTDKFLLIAGRPTRITETTNTSPQATGTEGQRARTLKTLDNIAGALGKLAEGIEGTENSESPEGSERIHGVRVPGSENGKVIDAAVVSSGVAERDGDIRPSANNSPEGSRENNTDSDRPDSVGDREQS